MDITLYYYLNVGLVSKLDYKDLMVLIDRLDQSSVAYIDYQTDSQHVVLAKEVPQLSAHAKQDFVESDNQAQIAEPVNREQATAEQDFSIAQTEPVEEKTGELVESPMVGVVYLQPHPDEDAFVKVGDHVEQGDVICIVEAMKLMNEIQAPHGGIVTEVLVDNEEVVEYKQPLIRID